LKERRSNDEGQQEDEFSKKERMVGILCGEFAKSREPLDLTEESRGVTASIPKGSKLRRSRTIDPSHKGHWIYTWILYRVFVG
jgi:hypothetical protein